MANEESKRGVNSRAIFVSAIQQVAIYGVASRFKISEKSAILLALSRGLKEFGFMSEEDYQKDFEKRTKPLPQIVEEKKEEENKRNRLEEAKTKYDNEMSKNQLLIRKGELEESIRILSNTLEYAKNKPSLNPNEEKTKKQAEQQLNDAEKELAEIEEELKELKEVTSQK